ILERVGEGAARRQVGLTKRRQVGSDEAKPVRQLRDEIAEHMTGCGKAVQQEDRRRVLRPSLAIEHSDAVDIYLAVHNSLHGNSFRSGESPVRPPELVHAAASTAQGTDVPDQSWTTTIFPPASPASMTRCASRISSKRKTRVGFALNRPCATCAAMFWSGTSESGNCGVPKTKLPKKVR